MRKAGPAGVVHLTAEYWPLARTGGLGEAVAGLATIQARESPTVVILPLYRGVRHAGVDLAPLGPPFALRLGPRQERGRLWQVAGAPRTPRVVLVEHGGFFDRPGLYGEGDGGGDYPDNARRFAFLTLAALRALPQLASRGAVVHAHDWHTALAPVFLRTALAADRRYQGLATVLTVHNAAFQGHFPYESLHDVGVPTELYDWRWLEWYGRVNWLKGGLAFTDVATTVSPTHAYELRTEAGGFGLHDAFVALGDRFVGVLNGIDQAIWDPGRKGSVEVTYSADDLLGKARCKAALQGAYGLPQRPDTPVVVMTARLVAQKGIDLVLASQLIRSGEMQFIYLGMGEVRYQRALAELARGAPDRLATDFEYTDGREHRLLAGADILLMPSLYEPCGLAQMRAQRYGVLPVARRVGGLADTIVDGETGFLFDEYTPEDLDRALGRALALYRDAAAWEPHLRVAMTRDFDWTGPARQYLELYQRAVAERSRRAPAVATTPPATAAAKRKRPARPRPTNRA